MKKTSRMSIVHPHAAGVDIGAEFHVVAVPPDADTEPVRTFQSFTGDLQRMSDWLKTCHITTVAMESTGVYWLPAFEILEAAGFKVILVNARDAKNVPGRKTDVNDAQWLQKLHSFGLLRASFRPEHDISVLRSYLRQRERLTEYRAAHIQHIQKALMQMNVQLHHAVSDITGVTHVFFIQRRTARPLTFWFKPVIIFGLFYLTTFISSSLMLTLPGSLLPICVMLTDNKQISRLSARNTGKRCLRGLSTSRYQKADLG